MNTSPASTASKDRGPTLSRVLLFVLFGLALPLLVLVFAVDWFGDNVSGVTLVSGFVIYSIWVASLCNALLRRVTISIVGWLFLGALLYTTMVLVTHITSPLTPTKPLPLQNLVNLGKCEYIGDLAVGEQRPCPNFNGYIGARARAHTCPAGFTSAYNNSLALVDPQLMVEGVQGFRSILNLAGQLYASVCANLG